MSIGIVIKGPEGLVLATDSRITLTTRKDGSTIPITYDNARKVLQIAKPHNYVGTVTYGLGGIGLRSAYSFLHEFESTLPKTRLSVADYAQNMSNFFMQQWNKAMPANYKGLSMVFVVGGFDKNQPYGRVYLFEIPRKPKPTEQHPMTPKKQPQFGITWGGQREIVDRLIAGYDVRALGIIQKTLKLKKKQVQQLQGALLPLQIPIPIQILPLQDCVDLAILFVATTIEAQRLTAGIRGCGGPIDIATITRLEGFNFVQEKSIHGQI